jgi:hypothetical protein
MSYSKRRDLSDELSQAIRQFGQVQAGTHTDGSASVSSEHAPRLWRVADRLTAEDVQRLIVSYNEGATAQKLAADFTIGVTNVKRLLREHGARRKDQVSAAE